MALTPIDEGELRRLRQVDADNATLRSRIDASERSNATLQGQVQERDNRIAQLTAETGRDKEALQRQVAELSNQNRELQGRIDRLATDLPRVTIKDLVEGFRTSVAQINKEVLTRPAQDQTPVVIEAIGVPARVRRRAGRGAAEKSRSRA